LPFLRRQRAHASLTALPAALPPEFTERFQDRGG
jgi:hypothetical protein